MGLASLVKRRNLDMTEGGIVKNILIFAFPLFLGNLFQQMYNLVDTWVIGQTGINAAYAAVGAMGPITNTIIGFFAGFATGSGVVISQNYGAKDMKRVHDAVHTAMYTTIIMSIILTIVGVGCTPLFLRAMLGKNTASAVYGEARIYLLIYFFGIGALLFYNMGTGILRAIGDTTRPFYFLVVSAVSNTILDLVFVFWFHWGVAGVAFATVLAELISAICVVVALMKEKSCIHFSWRELKLDKNLLFRIIKIGFPSGLQLALTAFANIFVTRYIASVSEISNVNNLPISSIEEYSLGAHNTYSKLDAFIMLPLQALAMSSTTFVGQNVGKGNYKRAQKGLYITYGMALVSTIVLAGVMVVLAPNLVKIFNSDILMVENGTMLVRYLTFFYIFPCANQTFAGGLRGTGDGFGPMIIMLSSFVGVRQIYLYFMTRYVSNHLLTVAFSYPVGWTTCATVIVIYYLIVRKKRFPKVKEGIPMK